MNLKLRERMNCKYKNYVEAALCAMIVDNFKHCGVDATTISVITPFLDQQLLLRDHLKPYGIKHVLTIDKAQGLDSEIVIISCTKQTPEKGQLLRDLKRVNVAITRAKKMLILIGTEEYLSDVKPLDQIVIKMKEQEWAVSVPGFDDQMKSYLPKEGLKLLSVDDISGLMFL